MLQLVIITIFSWYYKLLTQLFRYGPMLDLSANKLISMDEF